LPDAVELFALRLFELGARNRLSVDTRQIVTIGKHPVVALNSEERKRREDQDNDDEQQNSLMLANRIEHGFVRSPVATRK
jgi:hypothetical protein